ncbi:MCE family protein [Mycobacterium deserti]|uniref:MCE family protein n=1 Tax=Mycobacterium deserti TaxID=2978347 RepID=A0ABT2M6H8_9MYCO|nr:MCE family protein [Mycobacterium deserti]MCT7657857.1 MCE family protein [Mycobacterium deserti]
MRFFSERNPMVIGIVGIVAVAAALLLAPQYQKLALLNPGSKYSAYFAEAGGLASGAAVQVSGYRVGEVSAVSLDGQQVLVVFEVDDGIRLGERTEAAIKARTLLGAKVLELTPRGTGRLTDPIPVDRTTSPYQLADAIGDLSTTIEGLDTDELSNALATLSDTFSTTPPALQAAVSNVGRLSELLNSRDAQVRNLLSTAAKATTVLAERTDRVAALIEQTNALLAALREQSAALDTISADLAAMARQLSGFVADNRATLRPALDKLNGVLAILDNRKGQLQKSLKLLNAYQMSLGEAVSSGPFFNSYVANLLPGQFLQPFIDAAFSDLGLDPHVMTPSELTDPQTGQPGTPALPVPYPRTGQGGPPRLTLPDAITGVPGDPRYPYREPVPAPPPGGPPPGAP